MRKPQDNVVSAPIAIGGNTVTKTLNDPNFMNQMPEFRTLKTKLSTMRVDLQNKRGCKSCRQRRMVRSIFGDYVNIVNSLSSEALGRFKRYLGAERIMLNTTDPKTKQVIPKIL